MSTQFLNQARGVWWSDSGLDSWLSLYLLQRGFYDAELSSQLILRWLTIWLVLTTSMFDPTGYYGSASVWGCSCILIMRNCIDTVYQKNVFLLQKKYRDIRWTTDTILFERYVQLVGPKYSNWSTTMRWTGDRMPEGLFALFRPRKQNIWGMVTQSKLSTSIAILFE